MRRERDGIAATGVLTVLLVAWLGFFLHRSPRFPGSGLGAVFGIAAAALMLVPLAYVAAKRISLLNKVIAPHLSMKTLLGLHVYAGLIGPLLAIVHTGHKFGSWLGILLTALMLLVVVTGFAVRYLVRFVSQEVTDKRLLLQTARGDLDSAWGVLESLPTAQSVPPPTGTWAAGLTSLGIAPRPDGPAREVSRIAQAVTDLEYSVRMHELLQLWFRRSLTLHIAFSVGFYVLLVMHVGAAVQYGLRWLAW
jgi:hypothetical protein